MSEMKEVARHTPGPWEVSALDGRMVYMADGYWLEELSRERVPRWKGVAVARCHLDPQESAANARLIASAPDLLAACRKAFEALRPYFDVTTDRESMRPANMNAVLRRANDALAEALTKADGRNP